MSGADVRSVTETEVNFGRRMETCSEASGPSGVRSAADRSHSEMTYGVPVMAPDYPDTDCDDRLSAKTGRSLARSTSEFTEDWRHHEVRTVAIVCGISLVHSLYYTRGQDINCTCPLKIIYDCNYVFITKGRCHVILFFVLLVIAYFIAQEPSDRYSESSAGSRRHRQTERSVSEYMEEVPHYSDVATSPDISPQSARKFYDQQHFQVEQNYQTQQGQQHFSSQQGQQEVIVQSQQIVSRDSRQQSNVVQIHQRHEGRTEFRASEEDLG